MPEVTLKEMKDILHNNREAVHMICSSTGNGKGFKDKLKKANEILGNPPCKYLCMEPKYKQTGKCWLVAYEGYEDQHKVDIVIAKVFNFTIEYVDDFEHRVRKCLPVKCECA